MERVLDDRLLVQHVFVINLERRPDRLEKFMLRWRAMEERYAELRADLDAHPERADWPDRLKLTILKGFDGSERAAHLGGDAGRYGCLRSHQAALRQAPLNGGVPLLILEDDAIFEPFMERLQGMRIPSNWEVLWLGGEHRLTPEHVTNGGQPTGLLRVRAIQRGHAYIVRTPRVMFRRMAPLTGDHDRLMSRLPIAQYALWPGAVGQDAGESDVSAIERREPMFWNDVTPTGVRADADHRAEPDAEELLRLTAQVQAQTKEASGA